MKKTVALLLVILTLLFSFTSCTEKNETEKKEEGSKPKEETTSPTPEKKPSPSPTKKPSENNSPSKNEEEDEKEIGFGLYKITAADGRTLGFDLDTQEVGFKETDPMKTCWTVESYPSEKEGDDRRYYALYAGDLPKESLSTLEYIDENTLGTFYCPATVPYERNRFYLVQNENGSFSIFSTTDEKKAVSSKGERVSLAEYKNSEEFEFRFEKIEGGCDRYDEWISKDGIVTLRLSPKIRQRARLSEKRLQQFANDIETVYKTYKDLLCWAPYQHIIFKGYEAEQYPGYVIGNYMVISSDVSFLINDLKKMGMRDKEGLHDVNFLVLHEMGHMFDYKRQWKFEAEAVTDIKLVYVLYANKDLVAAPSEYDYKGYFNYENIDECYNHLSGKKKMTDKYNIYRCAYIFTKFGMEDNYESMKKTFRYFTVGEGANINPKSKTESLELFVGKLSEYLGRDIQKEIDPKEWEIIVERTKS